MKTISCINCKENILDMELTDYSASVFLKDYDVKTNKFTKMSITFNGAIGWICSECEGEISDDNVLNELSEYLPSLEDLENIDFDTLYDKNEWYIDKICKGCSNADENDSLIIEEGLEIITDVTIKFDKELNKFKVVYIGNAYARSIHCSCCSKELDICLDENNYNNCVSIPFFPM